MWMLYLHHVDAESLITKTHGNLDAVVVLTVIMLP